MKSSYTRGHVVAPAQAGDKTQSAYIRAVRRLAAVVERESVNTQYFEQCQK